MGPRLKATERRDAILDAAIEVFASHGLHGTTTAMLAEAAGVNEALLYRHFDGKKRIFLAAVQRVSESILQAVAAIVASHPDDPTDCVEALFVYFRDLLKQNPQFGRLIYVITAQLQDDEVRALYLEYQSVVLSQFEQLFEGWQERGVVRQDADPRAAAWVVLGFYQVLTLMQQSGRLDDFAPEHVRGVVRGFLGPEPEVSARSEGTTGGKRPWTS